MPIRSGSTPGAPSPGAASTRSTTAAPSTAKPATPQAPAKPQAWAPLARADDASAMEVARPVAGAKLGGVSTASPVSAPRTATGPTGPQSLNAVFDALPTQGGGPAKTQILSNGLHAWNARWDMLQTAKTSVDATYFIMEKDVFGKAFLGAMLEKQLAGVPTRVMIDAMADTFGKNGYKLPGRGQDYLQELVNAGGQAYIYNPVYQRGLEALKGGQYAGLASNHDKIFVVDGQKSVTGGRNIAADYFADPRDKTGAWRDMDVALDGAGPARGLTAAMDAEIAHPDVAHPVGKDILGNWDKKDIELLGAAKLMDLWLKDPQLSEADKTKLRADPAGRKALEDDLVTRALPLIQQALPRKLKRAPSDGEMQALHELAAELTTHLEARGSNTAYHQQGLPVHQAEAKILDQTSAAAGRTNEIAPALTNLVAAAKERIVIENPYVVLTEPMLQALEDAGKRGVKVDIVTNSPLSTDSAQTQAFFLEDWPHILARVPNARIFVATGDRKFHAKSAVVDGQEAWVSTYNLDLLSGYINSEVGAIVKSPEVARDLLQAFDGDQRDPANGFIEYTIQRNADGTPALKDGQPQAKFGPEDHLPQAVLDDYKKRRELWGHTLRDNVGLFEPLRHPGVKD